jgi:3-methyladenine DNA glycosylase AlkD
MLRQGSLILRALFLEISLHMIYNRRMNICAQIISELKSVGGNKDFSMRTLGAATYGAGDIILGVPVPVMRGIYKKYKSQIDIAMAEKLLYSEIHEVRFLALLAMIDLYDEEIVKLYLRALADGKINNWDLVDLSSHPIIGRWCFENNDLTIMNRLAEPPRPLRGHPSKGEELWENRVAMVSTWHFIRNGRPEIVFGFVEKLQNHSHHLIHKAMGWMLREAWKKIPSETEAFLSGHNLPRITISYATERMRKS